MSCLKDLRSFGYGKHFGSRVGQAVVLSSSHQVKSSDRHLHPGDQALDALFLSSYNYLLVDDVKLLLLVSFFIDMLEKTILTPT